MKSNEKVELPRIVLYGNDILRKKCEEVKSDENVDQVISELIATMYSFGGIGISAPQIGVLKNIVVWDNKWIFSNKKYESLYVMINPKILEESQEDIEMIEGCLSLPGLEGIVFRSRKIKVQYETANRKIQTENLIDLDARVVLHEIDHLEGMLFIDRLSKIDRNKIVPQLSAIRQAQKEKQAINI